MFRVSPNSEVYLIGRPELQLLKLHFSLPPMPNEEKWWIAPYSYYEFSFMNADKPRI